LPIHLPTGGGASDEPSAEQVRRIVERAQHLRMGCASAAGHDLTLLSREIRLLDSQLDSLVYGLYGLSDDDIAVVEAV